MPEHAKAGALNLRWADRMPIANRIAHAMDMTENTAGGATKPPKLAQRITPPLATSPIESKITAADESRTLSEITNQPAGRPIVQFISRIP